VSGGVWSWYEFGMNWRVVWTEYLLLIVECQVCCGGGVVWDLWM
jgi:hypothetical protein